MSVSKDEIEDGAHDLSRALNEKRRDKTFDARQRRAFWYHYLAVVERERRFVKSPRYGDKSVKYVAVLTELEQALAAVEAAHPDDPVSVALASAETTQAEAALEEVSGS